MTKKMRYGAASVAILAALLAASVPASAVELGSIPAGPDSLGLYPASTAALAACLAAAAALPPPGTAVAAAACWAAFNAAVVVCRATYGPLNPLRWICIAAA